MSNLNMVNLIKAKPRDIGAMCGILPMLILCEGVTEVYGFFGTAVLALVSLAVGAAAAGLAALKKERMWADGSDK